MKKIYLIVLLFVSLFTFSSYRFLQSVKVVIESNDKMQFNLTQIKVKANQSVTLTLKNTGQMPVQAMGHNWVLLQKGTDIVTFAKAAALAKSTDYLPVNSKSIIAKTKLIGGGQQSTITFIAPSKGSYDYICSFPGHFTIMKGKLIVE